MARDTKGGLLLEGGGQMIDQVKNTRQSPHSTAIEQTSSESIDRSQARSQGAISKLADSYAPQSNGINAELAVMRQAIKNQKPVPFYLLATAWRRIAETRDAATHARYVEILPELLDDFGENRNLNSVQFYKHICAVAVLTDVDAATRRGGRAIHVDIAPGKANSEAAQKLIGECLDLHNRALLHLASKPRKICVSQIFSVLTTLLSEIEAAAKSKNGSTGPAKAIWKPLEQQLNHAHEYYLEAAVRSAQLRYFTGTILGIVPFMTALAVLAIAGPGNILNVRDQELLAASVIAGAIGATISVMTRVTRKHGLQLQNLEESSARTLGVFGAIRPVVGAVFGAVVFLAVLSGMVPLDLPAPSGDLFFFAAFGFAAGFSERFAKDTLSRVESTLPPTSSAAHGGTPTARLLP